MAHPLEGTHVVIRQISIQANDEDLSKVVGRAEDYLGEEDKHLINEKHLYGEDREKVNRAIIQAINESSIRIDHEDLVVLKTEIIRASPLNEQESVKFLSVKTGISTLIYDEKLLGEINILKQAKSVTVLRGPAEGKEINVFSPFDLSNAFSNPSTAL